MIQTEFAMKQKDRLFTILISLAFIAITISQWIAWSNPVSGLETSFLKGTPHIYWFSYVFSLLLVLFIFLLKTLRNTVNNKILGFSIILLIYSIISFITLFIVRGYYMFILLTGDVGSHYGAVDSIVKTGFAGMHYPYLHIESAILEMITNIPHDQIINLVPVFYVLIFLCGVNLVIYKLTKNLQIRLLSLFISALLPFGCSQYSLGSWSLSMFIPYLAGFLVSVFILYFIFCLYDTRYRDWQNRVLLLLILMQIAVIFYHPVVFVVYTLLLIAVILQFILFKIIKINTIPSIRPYLWSVIVSGIIFVLWTIMVKRSASGSIRNLFWTIFGDTSFESTSLEMSNTIATSIFDYPLIGLIDIGIRYLGNIGLACFVLLALVPVIIHHIKRPRAQKLLCIYYLAAIGLGYYMVSLFVDLSVQSGRLLPYVILGGIIGSGFILYYLLNAGRKSGNIRKYIHYIIFGALIFGFVVVSIGFYYPSMDTNLHAADQTTHAEVYANDFYLTHINYDYPQESLGVHYGRMVQAKYRLKPIYQNNLSVSYDHQFRNKHILNYQNIETLNQSLEENTYFSVHEGIRMYYQVTPLLRYTTPKYQVSDFEHLEFDNSVIKYYSNPSMRLYLVI